MRKDNKFQLDPVDMAILQVFDSNARISMRELADRIGMSPPSTADRVRRLGDVGIIQNYTIDIDYSKLGYSIEAIMTIAPFPGANKSVEDIIAAVDSCLSCDKVTGEACYVARVLFQSIDELDKLADTLSTVAATKTSIVKSKLIRRNTVV